LVATHFSPAITGAPPGSVKVDVYDAMPSVGRKFLLAGKGGLNLTHAESPEAFLARYGARRDRIAPLLAAFGPDALRAWAQALGVETFTGSSGRVFPTGMKAAPLLRAWLHRLRAGGASFHPRHRWNGWNDDGALRFITPRGERAILQRHRGERGQRGQTGGIALHMLVIKPRPVGPLRSR